ncbi:MAG: hypothetical protein JXL80_09870 [Planctomycetes bacterium]|nr:hypothetical protein [Planctomycetota bacterium]
MNRKSRSTWVVLLVAILAVGIAVVGIVAVVVRSYVADARKARARANCAASLRDLGQAIKTYSAENRGRWPSVDAELPSYPERTEDDIASSDGGNGTPNNEAANEPQIAATQGEGQITSMVVTQTDEGRTSLTIRLGEGQEAELKVEPVRPMVIPTARRLERLELTDEQRQLVDAYTNEYRPLYDAKVEDLRARMNIAFEAVRAAQAAGDQQAEAEARDQISAIIGNGQREVVQELDDQYFEGLRTVLTEEQMTNLSSGRDVRSRAYLFGMSEMRQQGGVSTFGLIESPQLARPLRR